jgi:hypothetical protein
VIVTWRLALTNPPNPVGKGVAHAWPVGTKKARSYSLTAWPPLNATTCSTLSYRYTIWSSSSSGWLGVAVSVIAGESGEGGGGEGGGGAGGGGVGGGDLGAKRTGNARGQKERLSNERPSGGVGGV